MEQLTPEQTKELKQCVNVINSIYLEVDFDTDMHDEMAEVVETVENFVTEWEYISLLED